MNKLEKLLRKLDAKTRKSVEQALDLLASGNLSALDIKKIKGSANRYRLRVGRYRVIYTQTGQKIRLLAITKRDEQTYKNV